MPSGKKRKHDGEGPPVRAKNRRFKFKSFMQRLEQVDIDVFRSLDAIKFEPNQGSSFFHENLIQWRELNAAADFISAYDELLPLVQTLPELLLHKTTLINRLLQCLQPSKLLSLQPILSLIAVLSRDLGEDYLPFLPQIFDAFVQLLELGGDRDTAILEMLFTSVSYIFKYLLKLLSRNVIMSLKITKRLRYYHHNYVRVFAAESVSFLLRNAPTKQVILGVRKVLGEVELDATEDKVSACSNLLYYTLKGTSGGFHSRAAELLELLLHPSILGGIRKKGGEGDPIVEVIKGTLCSLCDDFERDKLELVWTSLLDQIGPSLENTQELRRSMQLLSLVDTMAEFKRGSSITDFEVLAELSSTLLSHGSKVVGEDRSVFLSQAFKFLLNLIKGHWHARRTHLTTMDSWEDAFQTTEPEILLPFVGGLLDTEAALFGHFSTTILSVLERSIAVHRREVLRLLLKFLQSNQKVDMPETLSSHVVGILSDGTQQISAGGMSEEEAALTWIAVKCFPYLAATTHCMDLALAIDRLVDKDSPNMWPKPLLGAALSSHLQAAAQSQDLPESVGIYLQLALKYPSSPEVLGALVDCVNKASRHDMVDLATTSRAFEKNLGMPSKKLRMVTLRLLSFGEESSESQVIHEILAIESSPLDIDHSRRSCTRLAQIKLILDAKRLPPVYTSILFHAMVGMLHIRFTPLWNGIVDCLTSVTREFGQEELFHYLSTTQEKCLAPKTETQEAETQADEIVQLWRSSQSETDSELGTTTTVSMMTLLLRVGQSVPSFLKSRSNQLLALFRLFLNFKDEGFHQGSMSGNDWKTILKGWLDLFGELKNAPALSDAHYFKELLINRFLTYNDPEIQRKALCCLLNWKDAYLVPYKDHLNNLISLETLSDELVTWNISRGSFSVEDHHRQGLIPVVLRILYPKMTKKAWKAAKTKSGAGHKTSILSFLSLLDPRELGNFYALILDPLKSCINSEGKSRWQAALEEGDTERFITWVDAKAAWELPHKRKIGFLHLAKDLLDVFSGEHIEDYLSALMAIVLRMLESSSVVSSQDEKGSGDKDVRGLCLKFISSLLGKFENVKMGTEYWDVFFSASAHSISKLREENVASAQPTALLGCILAITKAPELTLLLLRDPVLIPNMLSILQMKSLSTSVHAAVLGVVENILATQKEHVKLLLVPHLTTMLSGLAEHLSSKQTSKDSKKLVRRQLGILFQVAHYVDDPQQVSIFLDALLPFLRPKKQLDTEICAQVLKIIVSLSAPFDASNVIKCSTALGPLVATVDSQDARAAACQVLRKVVECDASFTSVAEIIEDLNSMATGVLGEPDYDRRQKAYQKLNHAFFSSCGRKQAVLLLSQLVFDLQSEEMRYNASSCLLLFVKAVGEDVLEQDVKLVVQDFLTAQFKTAMKSENATLRMEWLIVFRELVDRSQLERLSEFRSLISSDPEADFFSNIVHVQAHKRVKAMAKFRSACSKDQFSQESLTKVFVPLFTHALFEARIQNDGTVDAAVETLGIIAGHLRWAPCLALVMRFFHSLSEKQDHQKTLVRVICAILDRIHLSMAANPEEAGALQQRVLPELEKLMMKGDDSIVNVPIVLAMTKVLLLLPEEVVEREIPRLLQTISNCLKSRSQEARDAARSAIVNMMEALGAPYLQFAVKTLQTSLKRGYERHVLGYTLNSILARLVPNLKVGDIDYCVKDLVAIIDKEAFGDVAEEKEVEALAAKMKERKQTRSLDSLRLVAQVVTFPGMVDKLLEPAKQHAPFFKDKVRAFLKSIADGIQANASATEKEVLLFVRVLVEEFLEESNRSGDDSLYLLAEFGLQLLQANLKTNQLNTRDAQVMDTLDSYVGLLQRCLPVKYEGVASAALKSLCFVSKLPLPAIEAVGPDIVTSAFVIAESSSNPDNPLVQACLKLLIVVMRQWKSLTLSDSHLHSLLGLPIFINSIEDPQALSLFKAIVERKIVVPEVYDLVNRIQQLMITSQASSIQKRCSEVLLQFLLDYPLGPKRLQQHIDFLLNNLGYEHISGREAALEMLHAVICKFPEPDLKVQAESMFVTFVARLATEKSDHVRLLLQTALKVLMEHVGPEVLQRMKEFTLSWLNGEKQGVWGPAAQVTGIFIDVLGSKFERHIADFQPSVLRLLKRSSGEQAYYLLDVIGKLEQLFPNHELHYQEELWTVASALLVDKHAMVTKASARLFCSYLEKETRASFLADAIWQLHLASSFCHQLGSHEVEFELAEVVSKNLTLLAPLLHDLSLGQLCNVEAGTKQETMLLEALWRMFLDVRKDEPAAPQISQLTSETDVSGLMLVMRRLEKIALSFRPLQTKCIFRWYTQVSVKIPPDELRPYLPHVMGPLLRIVDSTEASGNLKTHAEEVRNELRRIVKAEDYAQVHNEVSQAMKKRKEKRKHSEAVAAVVDPEGHARKKIRLGLKKKVQKKRKRNEEPLSKRKRTRQ